MYENSICLLLFFYGLWRPLSSKLFILQVWEQSLVLTEYGRTRQQFLYWRGGDRQNYDGLRSANRMNIWIPIQQEIFSPNPTFTHIWIHTHTYTLHTSINAHGYTHTHTWTILTSTQTREYIHTHIQCPHSPAHMNVQTCTRGTYTHTNCYLFNIIFKIFDICIDICQSPHLKAQWYKQKRQKNIKNKLLWICTRIQYFTHTHNSIDAHWAHRDSSRNQRSAQL